MNVQKPKAHFVILLLAMLLVALADHLGMTQHTKTIAVEETANEFVPLQLAKTD